MTEKYIRYKYEGKSFLVPESKSAEVEKYYPDATIEMRMGDKVFNVPQSHKQDAINQYGSEITYLFEKEDSASPLYQQDFEHGEEREEHNKPGLGETFIKGIGAAGVGAAKVALDLGRTAWRTSVLGGAINRLSGGNRLDEDLRDENNAVTKASMKLGEIQERLSREADPTGGEKGYLELIKEGKIGQVAQKALGSGLESLPMMVAAGTGWGALLYGAGMAAGQYADETRENEDIPSWKRAANAIGSAALEMAVEKIGGPLKDIGKAGKEISEEAAKEILEVAVKEGTENVAKRIAKKIGKEGLEEGGEELLTSFGTDAIGQVLDWIDGDADYGITAQWNQMKEQDPNASVSDFAKAKAEEYMDSFIGGAISGMEISGTVEGANKGFRKLSGESGDIMKSARDYGASMNYGDMYDTDADVSAAKADLAKLFTNKNGEQTVSNEFIDTLSAEDAYALSERDDFSRDQRRAFGQLAVAKATQDGLNQKLDETLETNINAARERIESVTENGTVTTGMLNGRIVYVKGGVAKNGSISISEDGANGPVIVIDSVTGEETTANSADITSASSVDSATAIGSIESYFRENELNNRNIARNTMSTKAKLSAIQSLEGKKVMIDLGNGLAEVSIQQILPQSGEVLVKGKKGDLGGQSNVKIGADVFYDSISRDDNGNPIVTDGDIEVEEETPEAAPVETRIEDDFRGEVTTILINGAPVEVEVLSQDNPSDTIVYEYTDENGNAKRGRTTIGGFKAAMQQAQSYQPEAPVVETPVAEGVPTEIEPEVPASEETPVAEVPLTPESIDWDVLFEQDPDAYFIELQNQFGEETLDILNEEVEAAQNELETLAKAKTKSQNERLENRKKKASLQKRIEILNGMIARLTPAQNVATETPVEETPETPVDVAPEVPAEEPAPSEVPTAETPAEEPEVVQPEPQPVQSAPVAPNPVDNPIREAQKKEKSLATQLMRYDLSHELKQDLAFKAGKAVADFFATREEYDAYAESATDLGDYYEDFERGVDESFANRPQNAGNSPVNSVPLESEPNGKNNEGKGEEDGASGNGPSVRDNSGRTTDGGAEGGDQISPKVGKGKTNKGKAGKKVADKYPARKGNATQKLLVDTFGFNKVEIPNSRKETLNTIYDFMMAMSKMLGISPKSIGQGGWLDVGPLRSNASASAEHTLLSKTIDQSIVKATLKYKYSRLSGLAHEWWHALDHALSYFETGKGKIVASEIAGGRFTGRQETWEAVQQVIRAIKDSGHQKRMYSLKFPRRYTDYLVEHSEMAARAFDEYIKAKFADAGIVIENAENTDFIAQPTPEEMAVIAPAFDNLFKVLKEKEGKTLGTSILYHIGEMMDEQSDAKKLATEAVLTALDDTGIEVVRASDEQTQQMIDASGENTEFMISPDNPVFVSNAAMAVAGIKMEKATPEQWLKMIEKAGGLKAGEDKWMGLSDWLKASGKKTLTKDEVLEFIGEHMIQIEEQHYDINAEDDAERAHSEVTEKLQDRFDHYEDEYYQEQDWDGETEDARAYAIEKLREEMGDTFPYTIELEYGNVYLTFPYEEEDDLVVWAQKTGVEYTPGVAPINETRLNYTTDGLENKHEIALTVPTIERWGQHDDIHFGDAGDGRAVAWIRFGETEVTEQQSDNTKELQKQHDEALKRFKAASAANFEMSKESEKAWKEDGGYSWSDNRMPEEWQERRRKVVAELRESMKELNRLGVALDKKEGDVVKKVLVIDEIQSKRHQEGREKGYKSKDYWPLRTSYLENKTVYESLFDEMAAKYGEEFTDAPNEEFAKRVLDAEDYERIMKAKADFDAAADAYIPMRNAIPDAPFDKNWHELAMKRMLRYAAENGYDVVAWTKGDQQAERYNIGNVVEHVDVAPYEAENSSEVNGFDVSIATGGVSTLDLYVTESGEITSGQYGPEDLVGKQLSDVVGKDLAAKILSTDRSENSVRYEGNDFRIGGKGMKGFYDKMLPAFMNKYGKKWGVKVEDIKLPILENGLTMHSVPVTDAMKESVMEGQPMFMKRPNGTVYGWTDGKKIYLTKAGINPNTPIHEYTHLWAKAMMLRNPKGWESIKKLLNGTPVWNEVLNDPNYSSIHADEDLVASEVLSRISGSENAAKMEYMAQKMIDDAKGTGRKLEARGLIQNMRDALNRFWEFVWKDLFGMTNFRSVEHVTDRILFDLLNNTDLGTLSEGQVETQIVTDPKVIAELEASPKKTGYRNVVQNEDGSFSSPMAYWLQSTKGGAKTRVETAKFELGKWEEAEEHPELVDENGHVTLVKPNKSTVEVAYDPYIHNRLDPVNLQFKDAWKRDELVYVETEVPETDLESGYHADKALLPVGVHSWSNGDLILSKYDKPVRIMPWDAVADAWVARLNGEGVHFDVVPPALRQPLVERGVEILPPHKGMGKDCNDAFEAWMKENDGILSRREQYKSIPSEEYSVLSSNLSQRYGNNNVYGCVGYTSNYFYICDYIDGETLVKKAIEIEADEDTIQYIENYARRGDRFTAESFVAGIDSSRAGVSGEIWDFNGSQNEGSSMGDGMVDSTESGTPTESERDNGSVSEDNWITVKTGYDGSKFARIRFVDESELDFLSRRSDIQNAAVDFLAGEQRLRVIENAVNEEAAKLGVSVTYKTREQMPKGHENDKGYYNTKTGEVVVCTENASSIADAIQTILHEAVAHKGLRQLMGDKFNEFINRVYESLDAETKAKVDALAAEHYDGNTAVATEEYMASLAETEDFTNNSLWEKIKSIFEDIINAILDRNDIKIGDKELRYILRASYNNMVNPRGMESMRVWAQDQMMREEYNINQASPEILSRTGIDSTEVSRESAKAVCDKIVTSSWQEFQRQFQDAMQPVRIAIDAIQQETGNLPIEDYENFILIQNQASSRSRVEMDIFVRNYYSPIIEQVNKIIDVILDARGYDKKDKKKRSEVYAEIRQYLIAKHGLERNEYDQSTKTRKLNAWEKKKETDTVQKEYEEKVNLINTDSTLTDAERELQLRDALDELNAAIDEINTREIPDLRDYSGLTSLFGMDPKKFREAEEEAQDLVDKFEAQIGAESDALWSKINKATDKTLRHSYESGMISRQQYNDIKAMFKFYIPLRGFDETTAEDVYSYARFEGNRFNPAVQSAGGRTSLADDPLAIIMNMAESEIAQGNKNRAKQALYNFILNRPLTDSQGNQSQNSLMQVENVWYIKNIDNNGNEIYTIATPDHENGETYEEFENRMQALAAEDKAVKSKKGKVDVGMRFQKQQNRDAHYVYLKVNGVDKAIYINGDPKVADAINGVYAKPKGALTEKMSTLNRFISSTFTNYSLEFTARNYFRDMFYSHINIGVKENDPAYRKKFRQNWRHNNLGTMMRMLKAYRAGEYENRPLNEDEAAFVEFMANGGQTGYTIINSVENHKAELERAIKNMQNGIEKGGIKDSTAFKYTLGAIETLNEASELVTRFAAFKTSRDMGRGVETSINDAKEITVNFNTKGAQDGTGLFGAIARYFGWSKFFFNASVQGVQNIKAMAEANKLKFCSTVGGVAAIGFLMPVFTAVIAEILGGDDDEYWNIPEYERQNNFCIPLGGGKYVKIPLPIGFREVYAIGDMVAAMAWDKKFTRDAGQVGTDIANKIASVVLPINPLESAANGLSLLETVAYTLSPSSAQFIIQGITNTDWKGAPLQKEYTYNEDDPQWMKAFNSNPSWMVGLSKWCNEHIGSGDMKGWDWSPEKLDNTLSSVFGGIYNLVKKTGRSISMIWNEENRNLSNVPLTGVILGSGINSDDRFITDAYYDMNEYYDQRIGFIKRRAKKFGYSLEDVFKEKKGRHHPKMQDIYGNREFEWMREWYFGNKDLDKINDKVKKLKKEIEAKDNPTQDKINKLSRLTNEFENERRDFVNDMLELD